MDCYIWTVGKDYPVAILVEITLGGYGDYELSDYEKFEERGLGYASAESAKGHVEEMIRGLITTISVEFLETRDVLEEMFREQESEQK